MSENQTSPENLINPAAQAMDNLTQSILNGAEGSLKLFQPNSRYHIPVLSVRQRLLATL